MEEACKCVKIEGHLEAVRWQLWPRQYSPAAGPLAMADWTSQPHVWLYYVESADGLLADDDVLRSTDPRYWSIHDVQRYLVGELHCERVLFTSQYPQLRLPSAHGQHLWRANTALKLPPARYLKEFHISFEHTLKNMEAKQVQMDRIIISDLLIKIERLDYFKRKTFFRLLENILSFQDNLQLVSLENLCCRRLEGVRILQQLACFNAASLKYLFLWRFVLPNENPILINYSYITGSGQYIPRPDTKQCFVRSLAELQNLRLLALEYSHLADGSGGALLALLPVIKRPHFRLQLICREDQTPGRADRALGGGGLELPDAAWRRVSIACPDLYLMIVFFRIYEYDTVRRFLTPSMPLRETHLQLGIDLQPAQRQHSDLSCFMRHLAYRFANTLVTVSVHQWRGSAFSLRRVFELMPRLVRFHYTGTVEDEVDLRRMLHIISCGVCDKLKQVNIQIQDTSSRRSYWQDVVSALLNEYEDIILLFDIDFCMGIYKS
ncbi:uncharacterized protein [Epargyreus clarus]|uniref:uncharacterized protein n=1 Tax=Epargyreus clarus TaxID=520877 RepID=UPI003C2D3A4B